MDQLEDSAKQPRAGMKNCKQFFRLMDIDDRRFRAAPFPCQRFFGTMRDDGYFDSFHKSITEASRPWRASPHFIRLFLAQVLFRSILSNL